MTITPERFWQGYSWEQYLGRIRRNRELFQKSYDAVELTGDEEIAWLQRFEHTTYAPRPQPRQPKRSGREPTSGAPAGLWYPVQLGLTATGETVTIDKR